MQIRDASQRIIVNTHSRAVIPDKPRSGAAPESIIERRRAP